MTIKRIAILFFTTSVLTGCEDGPVSDANAETGTFLKSLTITERDSNATDGVAMVSCNDNETVVGGGCACTGSVSEGEAGTLFACEPVGNSYIGACYIRAAGQTVTKIRVKALCATENTGTALTSKAFLAPSGYNPDMEYKMQELRNMVATDITGK